MNYWGAAGQLFRYFFFCHHLLFFLVIFYCVFKLSRVWRVGRERERGCAVAELITQPSGAAVRFCLVDSSNTRLLGCGKK